MYRVVVSEKTKDMYGDCLEILGDYNPHTKKMILKAERVEHWLSVGAQPSNTVHNLLIKEGLLKDVKKAKSVSISQKRKDKKDKKESKKSEAKAEDSKVEDERVKPEDTKEDKVEKSEVKEEKVEESTKDIPIKDEPEEKKK